jgi:tetratricopeptide (TPR) repeat protein
MSPWFLLRFLWLLPGRGVVLVLLFILLVDNFTLRLRERFTRRFMIGRRIHRLEMTLRTNPQDRKARAELGDLLVERGRYEDAVEVLKPALDADPGSGELLLLMGRACFGAGHAEQGEVFLAGAATAEQKPRLGVVDLELGRGRLLTGDPSGAIETLRRFCESRASTVEGRVLLAQARAATGDAAGAQEERRAAWWAYEEAPDFMRRRERVWAWRARPSHFIVRLVLLLVVGVAVGFAARRVAIAEGPFGSPLLAARLAGRGAPEEWVDEGTPVSLSGPAKEASAPAVSALRVVTESVVDAGLVERLNTAFLPLADDALPGSVPLPLFALVDGKAQSSVPAGIETARLVELLRAYRRASAYLPGIRFSVERSVGPAVVLQGGVWPADSGFGGAEASGVLKEDEDPSYRLSIHIEQSGGAAAQDMEERIRHGLADAAGQGLFPFGAPSVKTKVSGSDLIVRAVAGADSRIAVNLLEVLQPVVCRGPGRDECPHATLRTYHKEAQRFDGYRALPLKRLSDWFQQIDHFRDEPGDDSEHRRARDPVVVGRHPEVAAALGGHALHWRTGVNDARSEHEALPAALDKDGTMTLFGPASIVGADGTLAYEVSRDRDPEAPGASKTGKLRNLKTGAIIDLSSEDALQFLGFDGSAALFSERESGSRRRRFSTRIVRYDSAGTRTASEPLGTVGGRMFQLSDGYVAAPIVDYQEGSRVILFSTRAMRVEKTLTLPEGAFPMWIGRLESGRLICSFNSMPRHFWGWARLFLPGGPKGFGLAESEGDTFRTISDEVPMFMTQPAAVWPDAVWVVPMMEKGLTSISLHDGAQTPVHLRELPSEAEVRSAVQVGSRVLLDAGSSGLWVTDGERARKVWDQTAVIGAGATAALSENGTVAVIDRDNSRLHLLREDGSAAEMAVPPGSAGVSWDSGEIAPVFAGLPLDDE